jgi:hypothetical protein
MLACVYGAVAGAAGVGALRAHWLCGWPIAGETGISEAIGGVIGGLVAEELRRGRSQLQTKAADIVSPEGVRFKNRTGPGGSASYAAIVGGGLSFGKQPYESCQGR